MICILLFAVAVFIVTMNWLSAPELEEYPKISKLYEEGDDIFIRTTMDKRGGIIDLGWVVFEFPEGVFSTEHTIEIHGSELELPRNDLVIATKPLEVNIHSALEDASSEVFHGEYTCRFMLNELPVPEGEFDGFNPYVDIQVEWTDEDGRKRSEMKWAEYDGDSIYTSLENKRITVALVDYSRYAELVRQPSLTKEPREVLDFLKRRYGKTEFLSRNEGPLDERIPVVLIHGLNLMHPGEDVSFSDQTANRSKDIWQPLFDVLNYADWIYDDFKFFWFEYSTADEIFGENGNGRRLKKQIEIWAKNNDPDLLEKPIVIIAHSMGGLVARDFMQNQDGNVFRLMTICTPHYGSPVANLGMGGTGELYRFVSDGVADLACNEEITYMDPFTRTEDTSFYGNLSLAIMNTQFSEDDPRLICYGATSGGIPRPEPTDPFDKLMLETLSTVTGPEWLMETNTGFRSDGIVTWRSQYFRREGGFPDPAFERTSKTKFHRTVFEDFDILVSIYKDLTLIRDEY